MRRMTPIAALALAAALTAPATSLAGGFATVGLSSLPEDVRPGDTWVVDVTVLAHGVTPVEHIEPRVMIAREGAPGSPARAFDARPAGDPGVYRARVEFPSKGFWAISVDDGYTQVHEFGGVRIGDERTTLVSSPKFRPLEAQEQPAAATGRDGSAGIGLGTALLLAALTGLVVAAVTAVRSIGRRPEPASG